MGFYPPKGENEAIIADAVRQADPDPPFMVRDKEAILRELGKNSLPLDFTAIPMMNNSIERFTLLYNGCPFVLNTMN